MQNFTPRVLHNNFMNVSDMMISFRSCLFRLSSPFLLPLHEAWFRVQFNRTESVITFLSQIIPFRGTDYFFVKKRYGVWISAVYLTTCPTMHLSMCLAVGLSIVWDVSP